MEPPRKAAECREWRFVHTNSRPRRHKFGQCAGTAGVLEIAASDWADVHRIAEEISSKHTESGGHRLVDILHVATALHLGAETFLTFDSNQKRLAEAEGLTVPV
ncbi:MAG: PIN domain-containing protein [Candidatus Competibacteraceae bacterium]